MRMSYHLPERCAQDKKRLYSPFLCLVTLILATQGEPFLDGLFSTEGSLLK